MGPSTLGEATSRKRRVRHARMPTNCCERLNPPSLVKPAGYSHGWEAQGGKTVFTRWPPERRAEAHCPAMTLMEVKGLYDDGALIEIEGIAVVN